jgi:tripartite-type tricarboxylate transporter receptor subunit TctC
MVITPYRTSCTFTAFVALLGGVQAQEYPAKPIRIVTSAAGGGSDLVARMVAQGLTAPLGQQVVVDNRGDTGAVATMAVAKAPPDGYTLLSYGNTVWLLPFLRDNVPYDPVKDFSPVSLVAAAPNILVAHPSLPVKDVAGLVALAKSKPGDLNYGTSGTGNSPHLATELFKSMTGVQIIRINYKGAGRVANAMIAGEVHLAFSGIGSAMPHVRTGRLKALAVTGLKPSALAPGLPTVAGSGLPGFQAESMYGLFAPAQTPPQIVAKLHQEIVRTFTRPEVKERFFGAGVEVVASTPEQLADTVKSEMAIWGKVIRAAGIREE